MSNQELVKILYEMAALLEIKEVAFKPQAYERAAYSIEALGEDASEIYKKGGLKALENIPGVGQGIAERIEEYIKTGRIADLRTYVPTYHGDGRADWTFAVVITYKDSSAMVGPSGEDEIVKRLYPDQATFKKEE